MKNKEHSRQVRDTVVKKFKAGFGYKKIIRPLQIYQDLAVPLNFQLIQKWTVTLDYCLLLFTYSTVDLPLVYVHISVVFCLFFFKAYFEIDCQSWQWMNDRLQTCWPIHGTFVNVIQTLHIQTYTDYSFIFYHVLYVALWLLGLHLSLCF